MHKRIIILSAIIFIVFLSLLNYGAYAEDTSTSSSISTQNDITGDNSVYVSGVKNGKITCNDKDWEVLLNAKCKIENGRVVCPKDINPKFYENYNASIGGTSTSNSTVGTTQPSSNTSTSTNSSPFNLFLSRSHKSAETSASSLASITPSWFPQVVGAQIESINQWMPSFHNDYQGPQSLSHYTYGKADSQVYAINLGSQLTKNLQAYTDIAWFKGSGISGGMGAGGYVNGDMVRAGSSNLPEDIYIARAYLKYSHPFLSEGKTETVDRGPDQLAVSQSINRIEMKIGKLAAADDFDLNRYANNSTNQFFNYDFMFNTAWDYAADTRGYSYGIVSSINQEKWRWATGVYMMPDTANGAHFDFTDVRELGYNTELTLKPNKAGTVVRLLSYLNEGRMGNYNEAISLAQSSGTTPSLLNVEKEGNTKFGFGLNFEQPLLDNGETGLFGRLGWNNGKTETWCYTEADRNASIGAQISGIHWNRKDDHIGIAYGLNGLSQAHRTYLSDGGTGILLGDGSLNYGLENVMEIYYRIQLGSYIQITPDFQLIANPGYNSDRGPAEVFGIRLNLHV